VIKPADGLPTNLGDLVSRAGVGARLVLIDLRDQRKPVEISATEFDRRIKAFANTLLGMGIKPGQRVGFLSGNCWEFLAAYLGTMYCGAVAVPVNYKFPRKTVEYIIRDSDISLLFHDRARQALVPDHTRSLDLGQSDLWRFPNRSHQAVNAYEPEQDDVAEILYTSGSTGVPKGVPLTHKGQLWALSKYLEPVEEDTASGANIIVAPLYHMNAVAFSCAALLNASTIILQPTFDAATFVKAAVSYGCKYLSGIPTMFAMVVALDDSERPDGLDCIEEIKIGSAPLSSALLDGIRRVFPVAEIHNSYGSTEAGPAIFGPHPRGIPQPPLSIGYPFAEVKWRLTGGESADEGELELITPALVKGYLNRPDADQERFADGWYKTGDIMRRDENGFMYFVSRADDMFVCGGENIFPGEVEALLNLHPQVQESLVTPAPDDLKGTVPVAFVVPVPGTHPDEETLKHFCLENAPAYAHPRKIFLKDKLPVSGTFKIERRVLEAEASAWMVKIGRSTDATG